MMPTTFILQVAGYRIHVAMPSNRINGILGSYILPDEGSYDFAVEVTPEDVEADHSAFTALLRKTADALAKRGVLLFHASLMAVDGFGYAYTAPSGTGKSTHTALLRKHYGNRVQVVNDDKPFLRLTEKGVFAYGSPWCGQHHLENNIAVPLHGIAILRRSETNSIQPAEPITAYAELLSQIHRPADVEGATRVLEVIQEIMKRVPVYTLYCNMEEEAAVVSYEGMSRVHFEDLLERDGQFVYKTKGNSMYPLIRENRDIIRIGRPDGELKKYDVVLYKCPGDPSRYILHRILSIRKDGTYNICGDHCYAMERRIPHQWIVGKLIGVSRGGKEVNFHSLGYRLYIFFYCRLSLIRRALIYGKCRAFDVIRILRKKLFRK